MNKKQVCSFSFLIIFCSLCNKAFLFSEDFFAKNTNAEILLSKEAFGTKLVFPVAEIRFYQTADQENQNFGFACFSDKITSVFPCSIKCGNLSPGGLFSKLKNPLLSTSVSPFGTAGSNCTYVTANLPGASAFTRPQSYYMQFGFAPKKHFLKKFNLTWFDSSQENIQTLSGFLNFKINPKLQFSISSASGYFDFDENSSNSWFLKNAYYHKGSHFCNASQLALTTPLLNTLFTLCMYESPFGSLSPLYRLDSKIKTNRFAFSFSSVYLPGTIITASDSTQSQLLQIKTGIQNTWLAGNSTPFFIKTGINAYSKINLGQEEHPVKIGTGIQLTFPKTVISGIITASSTAKYSQGTAFQILFDSISFQLQNSWRFKILSPSAVANLSINPSDDFTTTTIKESFTLTLFFTTNPSVSNKTKFEITQKTNTQNKYTLSDSINLKAKIKKLTVICKFSLEQEF